MLRYHVLGDAWEDIKKGNSESKLFVQCLNHRLK